MKKCSIILLIEVIICLLLMANCASLHPSQPQKQQSYAKIPFQERYAELGKLNRWNIQGIFSIQPNDQDAFMAHYSWQQLGRDQYHINIYAALNLFRVVIDGQPNHVRLETSRGEIYQGKTPSQIMQQSLGWSLPIFSLWYWVRGIPAPGYVQKIRFDSYGHMIALEQNGWVVSLADYQVVASNGIDLPRVINLNRQAMAAKIKIKHWSVWKH